MPPSDPLPAPRRRRIIVLGAVALIALYAAGALSSYVVPSDEGPHRKYYGINAQGRTMLASQGKTWTEFAQTMESLLNTAKVAS